MINNNKSVDCIYEEFDRNLKDCHKKEGKKD